MSWPSRSYSAKERAEYLLKCLDTGAPIEGVDNVYEMLALAGACFFAESSHGSILHKDLDWSKIPLERREAISETLNSDIHAAVEWYAQATMWVRDGEYDDRFDPIHKAILTIENGKRMCRPVEGFRRT